MKQALWAVGFVLCAAASAAHAQATAEKKKQSEVQAALKLDQDALNARCGTAILVTVDWRGFKNLLDETHDVAGFCQEALDGIRAVCSSGESEKAWVRKSVRRVVCHFGGPGRRYVKLLKGTLDWTIDWDAPNDTERIREFLLKTLE